MTIFLSTFNFIYFSFCWICWCWILLTTYVKYSYQLTLISSTAILFVCHISHLSVIYLMLLYIESIIYELYYCISNILLFFSHPTI